MVEAIADGLPLPAGRKVAALPDERQQEALEPFRARRAGTSRSAAGREVLRLAERVANELRRRGSVPDPDGWVPPADPAEDEKPLGPAAWVFPSQVRGEVEREVLHPWVTAAIVSRFSAKGARSWTRWPVRA